MDTLSENWNHLENYVFEAYELIKSANLGNFSKELAAVWVTWWVLNGEKEVSTSACVILTRSIINGIIFSDNPVRSFKSQTRKKGEYK